jgi:hypothetical protein
MAIKTKPRRLFYTFASCLYINFKFVQFGHRILIP